MSNLNVKDAEYKLAQSGDATCNGLDSAEVSVKFSLLSLVPISFLVFFLFFLTDIFSFILLLLKIARTGRIVVVKIKGDIGGG